MISIKFFCIKNNEYHQFNKNLLKTKINLVIKGFEFNLSKLLTIF